MLCDLQSNIVIGRGWSAVRREDGLPLYLSSWSHGSLYVSERHAQFGPRWACSTGQVQTFDDNSAAEIVSTNGRDLLTRLECGLWQNLGRRQLISAAGSIGMASLWPLYYRGPKPHRLNDDETCLVSRTLTRVNLSNAPSLTASAKSACQGVIECSTSTTARVLHLNHPGNAAHRRR